MKISPAAIAFTFLAIVLSICSYAQQRKIDSLKNLLQNQQEDSGGVRTLNQLGFALLGIKNFDQSKNYIEKALALAEKIGDKRGVATSQLGLGYYYSTTFNNPEALKHLFAALETGRNIKYESVLGECLQLIGAIYIDEDNGSDALKYLHEALDLNNLAGDSSSAAQNLNTIGEINLKQGAYTAAFENHNKAFKLITELGNKAPAWALPWTYVSFANVFKKQGDSALEKSNHVPADSLYNMSLKNYLTGLELWKKVVNDDAVAEVYTRIGELYIQMKKDALAKDYLEKGLDLSLATGTKTVIRDCYKDLAALNNRMGNCKAAYDQYQKYELYKDSLSNEESRKKYLTYKMQYEFDKKEAAAKTEQDKKDADTTRVRNLQYTAIIIFLLVTVLLFWNNRQKQKAKGKIERAYAELQSTQAQLIQSEKMASLGELTAGIAHEIQNPLNFVNNFSEVSNELIDEMKDELSKGNYGDANAIANDVKQNLEKINHHGRRAGDIVKGMLQHSRSSSGVKEPTDINKLADEYLRLAYHGLRAKDKTFNATLKTDFDETAGSINIIPQDMGRVILNLITNAFYVVQQKEKETKEKPGFENPASLYQPTVSVSTKKTAGKILISVRDNGNGIPQEILDKIFQPFFTTKPTGQGTGLGLSLSYDIVTKGHGGELKVETKQGEGSTFIISIPVKEQA